MLVVLVLIFLKEKSLDYSSRRRFLFAALSCTVCLTLDILSLVFIHLATDGVVSREFAKLFCKLYLVSLVQQAYQGFRYAAGDFFAARSHKFLSVIYVLWFAIGSVVIMALPIDFFQEGRVAYSSGPSTIATYIVVLALIGSTIFMAFKASNRSIRKWSILVWQFTWLLAAALQFLFQGLLLVGFAAAFGIVLIYTELENPHEGIDRMTGQFTANALLSYINDLYTNARPFVSVMYRISYVNQNVDFETSRKVLCSIASELGGQKDAFAFRYSDKTFTVVYKDDERARKAYTALTQVVSEKIAVPVKLSVVYAPDSQVFSSADEYLKFLHYCDNEMEDGDFTTVDKSTLDEMRKYDDTVNMITSAMEEGRVVVYLQPIYNVEKKMFNSAEALVRIIDENGDLIPPGKFIPIAEQSGLIVPLGKEVLKKTCEFLADGRARKMGLDYIEVNLSPVQFDANDPAGLVQRFMREYNIKPEWINLEITETDSDRVKQFLLMNMNKLIDSGISFSLDDFGTGRSNLDYFVAMPVSIIKFDYTFTQSYFKNEKARLVMESVVELMKNMGLHIVAEGVETKRQFDEMVDLGITYIQGYYFSRPVSTEDFLDFITEKNAVR